MLKTLTIAILLGLTSGRPSVDSGQEVKISESKNLIYTPQEFPNAKKNFMARLEEMPDLEVPLKTLLRTRRASNSSMTDNSGTSGSAPSSALLIPLQATLSVVAKTVITLVETIFALVSGILNPILYLLTELLNPILLPLRPILNPILLPLNTLLTNLLKALHLSLSLSGLLTGKVTNPVLSAISASNWSSDASKLFPTALNGSDPSQAASAGPAEDDDGAATSMPSDLSQDRRRRAISQFPLSNLVIKSRSKRQSNQTSIGLGISSILSVPLRLVQSIISLVKNAVIAPLESILIPIFSLLHLPTDLISQPLDLVVSLLTNVTSLLTGITDNITGSIDNLAKQSSYYLTEMLSMPRTLANRVQDQAGDSSRRRRSLASYVSTGPLDAILSFLFSPLKTLFSYLPSLLDRFNISYTTLQEAVQVFFSKAAKSFFTMAYNEMKNVILPGVDELLQSIVGSEYIPDYINSSITQFHTIYQLLKMVGYLRPS